MSEDTYKIVRFFADENAPDHRKVVKTGLTLEEAQAWCQPIAFFLTLRTD